MFKPALLGSLCFLTVACASAPQPAPIATIASAEPQFYRSPRDTAGTAPFSEAVQVGETLWITGQLGTVPGAGLVPGGIEPETRQALENIKDILERHGTSMSNVVKCTVFLADIKEWGAMNGVYTQYFTGNRPSRSALGVGGLALDGRVEIECVAWVPPATR